MDPITALIVGLLLLEIPLALVSAAYIVWVQRPVRGHAPFLDMLVRRDVRVALAGGAMGILIVYTLLRLAFPAAFPAIPSPWTTVILGLVLIVFLMGPIVDAWKMFRERRLARMKPE